MVLRIDSDTEADSHPKRVPVPSAKLISADNAADHELPSHRRAHIASRTTEAPTQSLIPPPSGAVTSPSSSASCILDSRTDLNANDSEIELISSHSNKRLIKGIFICCFTCTTGSNTITFITGRKRADSPDADFEPTEPNEGEDTPAPKKRQKQGICPVLL
jgi:hypothetical protein